LTDNPFADVSPSFSPDGTLILFVSKRPTDNNPDQLSQVFIMDMTGDNIRQATKIDGANLDPVFVP